MKMESTFYLQHTKYLQLVSLLQLCITLNFNGMNPLAEQVQPISLQELGQRRDKILGSSISGKRQEYRVSFKLIRQTKLLEGTRIVLNELQMHTGIMIK